MSRREELAEPARVRLEQGLDEMPAECRGLGLFTADDPSPADVGVCATICDTCGLFELCEAFARLARPAAGVWAGKSYAKRPRARAAAEGCPSGTDAGHAAVALPQAIKYQVKE